MNTLIPIHTRIRIPIPMITTTIDHHGHAHLHKSALTGALQGLGGSAALMLVTLSTVNSVEIGVVFIFLFGVGVILGMVGIACLVGSVMAYTASNLEKVHKIIKALTGSASIVFWRSNYCVRFGLATFLVTSTFYLRSKRHKTLFTHSSQKLPGGTVQTVYFSFTLAKIKKKECVGVDQHLCG